MDLDWIKYQWKSTNDEQLNTFVFRVDQVPVESTNEEQLNTSGFKVYQEPVEIEE